MHILNYDEWYETLIWMSNNRMTIGQQSWLYPINIKVMPITRYFCHVNNYAISLSRQASMLQSHESITESNGEQSYQNKGNLVVLSIRKASDFKKSKFLECGFQFKIFG